MHKDDGEPHEAFVETVAPPEEAPESAADAQLERSQERSGDDRVASTVPGGSRHGGEAIVPLVSTDDGALARKAPQEPAGFAGPQAGAQLGQYELIRELGRGGMGTVFLARDTWLGRRVAIKFMLHGNPQRAERFLAEARATARCKHDNIVVI